MSGLDHLDYDDVELLAEVHHLASRVIKQAGGSVPAVGSASWWSAGLLARLAGLLVVAEAYLVSDPHAIAAERLKAASLEICAGYDWAAASRRPSHAELVRRRAEPGPLARLAPFDLVAARRWVETGRSEERAA